MRRRRITRLAGLAAGALAIMALTSPASAQDIGALGSEINTIDRRIDNLENEYLKPAVLASRYKTEARFNDAKVAYFLKDYHRSAVLFVDIVDRENQGFGSYREALFLLGDSLFQIRNFKSSRRYLRQLLDLGTGPFYEEAARRYIETAFETRNFDGVEDVLRRVQGSGSMNAGLRYISGKALYQNKNYDAARAAFAQAATAPEYRMQADYFRGVAFAAEGKIDDARQVFTEITRTGKPQDAKDLQIWELAYIAQGRLAYEKADYDSAIDLYGRVSRTSPHFDAALWEMTWTLIAKGMFREARRNVEILLFSDPNPRFLYEAKLLKADLSVRLEEYGLAEEDFRDVLATFKPVKNEMDDFIARQGDLRVFFDSLVQDDLRGVEREMMPPLLEKWLETDATIRTASRLIEDVRGVRGDLDETERVLQEVNARLNSSTRVQSFPQLAEGMALGIEADSQLVGVERKLLDAEYARVGGRLSGADAQQWATTQTEIASLSEVIKRMPNDRDELAKREQAIYAEFARLQRQLDEVAAAMDAQRAILTGVDVYVQNEYGEPLAKAQKSRVDALRLEARNNLAALDELEEAIRFELRMIREQVGVGDAVVNAERALRERYSRKLKEAAVILTRAGGDREFSEARTRVYAAQKRLDQYFQRMDGLVDEKVGEIRREVDTEEQLVSEHRASLSELVYASQSGAGVLAYVNFMRARAQFNELIMRGEVGLVDVMWQKKEEMSNSINQLFEERTTQLKLLQDSFEEVR